VTEQCLTRIAALNPRLNAMISVHADGALTAARAADRARTGGPAGAALHGIPISLKDLIDEAGQPTTAASRVRRDVAAAAADATVTARLRAAGAILIGRANLHEFAFGPTGEDSAFGPARNPVDDTRVAGGSSGGSAIAVATGMSLASIGTDTGGSIRIPAAACGVVGLKPTWGEIPTDGIVPLSRQLDHVGPLARTVTDAWLVHETLAGRPPAAGQRLDPRPMRGVRLGLLRGPFADHLDPDVAAVFDDAVEALRRAGADVEPAEIALARDVGPVYLHLVLADAAAYHADTLERRPDDYRPNVRLRLEMGRYVLAEDYARALAGREIIARAIEDAAARVDALVCPTMPVTAPPIGATTIAVGFGTEPVRTAMLRLTQPFNVGRQPAITLPCGRSRRDGLPVGLQLAAACGRTNALLRVALGVERALAEAG
jgi:aspartyl-tRNA(Asn)/glutamyl-tRNA(Gln) amidotransferase subunit A